jgi:hypothetical protein
VSAYQNQRTEPYFGSNSNEDVPSLALKAGMPAADIERLDKLSLTMKDVDKKYRETEETGEKSQLMQDAQKLYDQMLSVACRITATTFVQRKDIKQSVEDPEIKEVREKILKIPLKLRAEYQERMVSQAEERLSKVRDNKTEQDRLIALIAAIKNPEDDSSWSSEKNERVRLILPKCREIMQQCLKAFPDAPSPVCYREGWYTPQCIKALEGYRVALQQKQQPKDGSATPVSTPSVISKF